MTESTLPTADTSTAGTPTERLARYRLRAPLRRETPDRRVAAGPVLPPPAAIRMWDEVVWGEVAPALWVRPDDAIILSPHPRAAHRAGTTSSIH